ncbi:hypothetical protein [Capybara microvirus Cap3_SP_319]|nr:hypothetical protein [Capybara microvirus Cap3_SP_319]
MGSSNSSNSSFGSLGGVLAQGIGNFLGSAINYGYSKDLADYSQMLTQENMKLQNQLQRGLILDSAKLEKEGLISAGLNPAMMNGGNFSPVASSSVGPSSSAGAASLFENVQLGNLLVAMSQSKVNEADAAGKNIDNEYKAAQNESQISLTIAKANESNVMASNISADTANKLALNDNIKQEYQNLIKTAENIDANTWNLVCQAYNNIEGIKIKWQDLSLQAQMVAINHYNAETNRLVGSSEAAKNYKMLSLFDAQIDLLGAQLGLTNEETDLVRMQAFETAQRGNIEKWERDVLSKLSPDEIAEYRRQSAKKSVDVLGSEVFKNFASPLGQIVGMVGGAAVMRYAPPVAKSVSGFKAW